MPDIEQQFKAAAKIILLVDDDPLIIRMYQKKLSAEGYKVNTAFNGEEGLTSIKKEKPDLILLDVMMPKVNGVEVLKTLKKDSESAMIPVIILTNLGDDEKEIQAAKDLGALDYLVKSDISLEELSLRVKESLASETKT